MGRLYADVEYFGSVYLDAELTDDEWHFEDWMGAVHPFALQDRVHLVNEPQLYRRHPPAWSGHSMRQEPYDGKCD
jgi:hypothetical protein